MKNKLICKFALIFIVINLYSNSNISPNTFNSKILMSTLIYSSYSLRSDISTSLIKNVIIDSRGNPIMMGHTNEKSFPFSSNAYKNKLDTNKANYNYNGFLLKQDKELFNVLNCTSLGIVFTANSTVSVIDKDDNVYCAIVIDSNYSNGNIQNVFNTHKSILLLKINSDFTKILSLSYFGNDLSKNESIIRLSNMKLDKDGNIIIAGVCDSNGIKTTDKCFQTNKSKSNFTSFISKFTPDFQELIFSSYFTDNNPIYDKYLVVYSVIEGLDIGADNDIYICGQNIISGNDPKIYEPNNLVEVTEYYNSSGFIAKISSNGNILIKTLMNVKSINKYGSGNFDLLIDKKNNIYVTGDVDNPSLTTSSSSFQPEFTDKWIEAGFIQCYDESLSTIKYSTYFGNINAKISSRIIRLDNNGDIYTFGTFGRDDYNGSKFYSIPITTKGAFPFNWLKANSYLDERNYYVSSGYIAIFNNTLSNLVYSTAFGGSDAVWIFDASLNSNNDLFTIGTAAGAIYFPITENALFKKYYQSNNFLSVFSNLKDQVSVDGFNIAPSNIFPNPASDYLNISFDSPKEGIGKIEIIDILGITVCSFDNNIHEGNNIIKYDDLNSLPIATYTVKVTINNEIVSIGKFIKR